MQTFGPVLVQDPRTKKGVPVTTAVVTDPATGDPVETFDLDGNPRSVTTDSRGYVAQWRADQPENGVIALDFGGLLMHVISLTATVGLSARMDALEAIGGGGGGGVTVVDNGDGTLSTSTSGSGSTITDNGDGTLTA